MSSSQFPMIEIYGSPRERGQMYGEQAKARIKRGISHYLSHLSAYGIDKARIGQLVDQFVPSIKNFDPALLEEMQGIAEGAKVDFEEIVLLNARTELLHEARATQKIAQESKSGASDGCTGVVVTPNAAQNGQLIHALNWDWKAECVETSVIIQIRQDNGPDILMFTEAGALARAGLNSAGTTITANYLESDQDFQAAGIPLALIRRKALEADTFGGSIDVIVSTDKLTSNNLLLSHRDGVALNLECAPNETFALYPENSLIVHANHWVSQPGLSKYRDVGIRNTPDSFYRDHRVRSLLEPQIGTITTADVKAALQDTFGSPYAVCRPPIENRRGSLEATVATLVFDSKAETIDITPLPALNQKSTTYHLSAASDAGNRGHSK